MWTQKAITDWAEQTFGPATFDALYAKLGEEMTEFADCIGAGREMEEMADMLIMMYQIAEKHGFDLHEAVEKKMKVNTSRTWRLHGDGTAQHV